MNPFVDNPLYANVENIHGLVNAFVDTDKLGMKVVGGLSRGAVDLGKLVYNTAGKGKKKPGGALLSPKKKMGKMKVDVKIPVRDNLSSTNQLAGRASMKRRGRSNVKVKQKKKVKVSKQLRKKIGAVLESKKIYGEFHKSYFGTIGVFQGALADTVPTSTVGDLTCLNYIAPDRGSYTTNNFTHWFCPMYVGDQATSSLSYSNNPWAFFTYAKVLDAASVLWNEKGVAVNPAISGNMSTRVDEGTGAVNTSRSSNLKIDVVNSFVTFEIKNNCQRPMRIQIKHLTPKVKVVSDGPLDSITTAADLDLSYNGPLQFHPYANKYDALTSGIFPWSSSPSFSQNWKYETVEIFIKAGETCTHSLQGPKNCVYDYKSMFVNGVDTTYKLHKGAVCAIFSVIPDMAVTGGNSSGLLENETGRFYPEGGVGDNKLKDPISVYWVEHYKLRMPEPSGGIQGTPTAGAPQLLNLRRPRKCYVNYAGLSQLPETAYRTVEEETANIMNESTTL